MHGGPANIASQMKYGLKLKGKRSSKASAISYFRIYVADLHVQPGLALL